MENILKCLEMTCQGPEQFLMVGICSKCCYWLKNRSRLKLNVLPFRQKYSNKKKRRLKNVFDAIVKLISNYHRFKIKIIIFTLDYRGMESKFLLLHYFYCSQTTIATIYSISSAFQRRKSLFQVI